MEDTNRNIVVDKMKVNFQDLYFEATNVEFNGVMESANSFVALFLLRNSKISLTTLLLKIEFSLCLLHLFFCCFCSSEYGTFLECRDRFPGAVKNKPLVLGF